MLSSQGYVHILKHRYYTCVKHTQIISYMQVNTQIVSYMQVNTDIQYMYVCVHCITCAQRHCVWTQKIRKMHDNNQPANEAGGWG